ncbi:MAG: adenylyl-sulfate kinase [Proteobacteria bacterium]|nr:adenylyl-sulfate kinase [Pseudomonadota bacterium]
MAMLPVRPAEARSELRFLACGSVDDGKSTLIGRLINDSVGLLDDQIAALKADSRRFGTVEDGEALDYALLLDGLEAEREQGITIDVAYRFFATSRRAFIVADTPGHVQFTRNMATGASNAELAVLLVDSRKGLVEQTRRHAVIVALLGIRHVVVAVNKVDLVGFSEPRFREIEAAFLAFARPLGFRSIQVIPVSALKGDNVTAPSGGMAWYSGPTLLEHLETVDAVGEPAGAPLRIPVQWINRPNDGFRGIAGTVASGCVHVGGRIVVAGSGQTSTVSRIVTFDGDIERATTGRAVTLTLADELDIVRGDMLAEPQSRPVVTRRLAADLIWMADTPGQAGRSYLLKAGTATVPATLTRMVDVLDVDSLERREQGSLELNAVGRVWIETAHPIAFDAYEENRQTGSLVLIDRATLSTVAAGMIVGSLDQATNVHHQPVDISPTLRAAMKGQQPLVLWLTGLPGAGKSTIANLVERRLVAAGRHTMLLDGDNLRQGLNADLGFDPPARLENVRRVGEVAKILTEAGLIVIVALVSPFRADRARAAALFPEGRFLEIFVDTPPEVCRSRDVKGLYRKAQAGQITNLTGLGQAYEPPEQPALVLRTTGLDADAAAALVFDLVMARN